MIRISPLPSMRSSGSIALACYNSRRLRAPQQQHRRAIALWPGGVPTTVFWPLTRDYRFSIRAAYCRHGAVQLHFYFESRGSTSVRIEYFDKLVPNIFRYYRQQHPRHASPFSEEFNRPIARMEPKRLAFYENRADQDKQQQDDSEEDNIVLTVPSHVIRSKLLPKQAEIGRALQFYRKLVRLIAMEHAYWLVTQGDCEIHAFDEDDPKYEMYLEWNSISGPRGQAYDMIGVHGISDEVFEGYMFRRNNQENFDDMMMELCKTYYTANKDANQKKREGSATGRTEEQPKEAATDDECSRQRQDGKA